jgi:cystathionine gamma-synthase
MQAGARLAVDSTVATPVFTRPLALGADHRHAFRDQVPQRSFRYLIAGALVTAQTDESAWDRMIEMRATARRHHRLGRGLAAAARHALAVPPRAPAGGESAAALARAPRRPSGSGHCALSPALPDFPGHDIARRQMQGGFGGMLSIRVKAGTEAAKATAARVGLWQRATSLGGTESLIEHRASIEGPTSPVPGDMLRLSVGLEDAGDLYDDLDQALSGGNAPARPSSSR